MSAASHFLRTFTLRRPLAAFDTSTRQALTVPAGDLVTLTSPYATLGVTSAIWNGQRVMLYRQDVEETERGSNPRK
jgi:hypothetical protein